MIRKSNNLSNNRLRQKYLSTINQNNLFSYYFNMNKQIINWLHYELRSLVLTWYKRIFMVFSLRLGSSRQQTATTLIYNPKMILDLSVYIHITNKRLYKRIFYTIKYYMIVCNYIRNISTFKKFQDYVKQLVSFISELCIIFFT